MSKNDEQPGLKIFGGFRLGEREGREMREWFQVYHIQGDHDAIDVMEGRSCICQ